jgi:hypothetical protein
MRHNIWRLAMVIAPSLAFLVAGVAGVAGAKW